MRMKFCKHCKKEHPMSPKFWFLNGGLLRKCKVHYKAYEKKRYQERRKTTEIVSNIPTD